MLLLAFLFALNRLLINILLALHLFVLLEVLELPNTRPLPLAVLRISLTHDDEVW